MAGRGRGGDREAGKTQNASERALFVSFGEPKAISVRVPRNGDGRTVAEHAGELLDISPASDGRSSEETFRFEYAPGGIAFPKRAEPKTFARRLARADIARGAFARLARRLQKISLRMLAAEAAIAATTEIDRGVAFLLVPVFLAAGVVFYFSLAAEPGFLSPVASSTALGAMALLARSRPRLHLALMAALLVALGVLCAKVETWRASTVMFGSEISTRLTGRVVSINTMANGRIRLTLDVLSTARPKLRYQPDRVRLSARAVPQGLTAGATVSGFARLMPPTGPVRPDSYDFSFQSYFDGIGASGFFLTNPTLETAAPAPAPSPVEDAGVRPPAADAADAAGLPPVEGIESERPAAEAAPADAAPAKAEAAAGPPPASPAAPATAQPADPADQMIAETKRKLDKIDQLLGASPQ